jgi:hypothetical protein
MRSTMSRAMATMPTLSDRAEKDWAPIAFAERVVTSDVMVLDLQ